MIRSFLLVLALALPLPALGQTSSGQLAPGAQPPTMQVAAPPLAPAASPAPAPAMTPAPVMAPAPTATLAPAPGDTPPVALQAGFGLCQCVSDTEKLDFSCPGSPQACQTACGAQFSFKPDALCRAGTAAATH
jgi:hypothetical protein